MDKIKLLGLTMILLVIFGGCYLSGFAVFFDAPSFLFVLGLTIGSLLYRHGKNGLMFWSKSIRYDERVEIAQTGSKACLISGVLGFFLGVIAILANLSDPSSIGPFLAVSLLTVVYSIFAYYIFFLPFYTSKDLQVRNNAETNYNNAA